MAVKKEIFSLANVKQETLYRYILEAIDANKLVTKNVDLRSIDGNLARAINQLRQAAFIDGIFHDIIGGSVQIEGVPIITLKGKQFLNELRSRGWRTLRLVVTIVWALIIGLSSIVAGIYYWLHLRS